MLCTSHIIVLYRILVCLVNMRLFALPRLVSFLRLCVRCRHRFGAPRLAECGGVLLPLLSAHLHCVRVGGEGKAVGGENLFSLVSMA